MSETRGRVLGPQGDPRAGAVVAVIDEHDNRRMTTSDRRGESCVDRLEEGRQRVVVWHATRMLGEAWGSVGLPVELARGWAGGESVLVPTPVP